MKSQDFHVIFGYCGKKRTFLPNIFEDTGGGNMKPGRLRAKKCGPSRKIQTRWAGSAFRALFYRKHCRTRASTVLVLRW